MASVEMWLIEKQEVKDAITLTESNTEPLGNSHRLNDGPHGDNTRDLFLQYNSPLKFYLNYHIIRG